MSRAVLSIGSNLGDRLGYLQGALDGLAPWLVATSAVYETPPWGPVPQDSFLNAVVIVEDAQAEPGDWLERAHAVEAAAGRVREVRWGPRTLDVDVISIDGVQQDDPVLTLPHPRAAERAFVLVPWLAVDPGAVLPSGPVADLIATLDPADVAAVVVRPELRLG
jgi:2-amino-4-hydroxy-6-hydroxymethyldihydropteridine diphosphokinase